MNRSTTNDNSKKKQSIRIWAVICWLLIWEGASRILDQEILLVSPVFVAKRLCILTGDQDFFQRIAYSMSQIILGFLLATFLGIILAIGSKLNRYIEEFLQPLFAVMKAIPVASFIILCLVFLSSKKLSTFIVFLMVLPIMYTNMLQGMKSLDHERMEMATVFEVPWFRKIRYIHIPAIWPFFYAACKVGIGFSFKSGIAAEVIGIPDGTIGERLYESKIYLDTPDLFAWTIVIVIISIVFEKIFLLLLRWLYRKITKRI
ncbi:ABC transporter permease [Anaerosporobacter faecicola]|uniref:ABC transporter permease n=1 Tax=Anaerosporobacter faecicola TaxID=2718714 RepID=UPI0014397421|nr:ABC transporter permease subunit [Anaerosporobacter faecicola]